MSFCFPPLIPLLTAPDFWNFRIMSFCFPPSTPRLTASDFWSFRVMSVCFPPLSPLLTASYFWNFRIMSFCFPYLLINTCCQWKKAKRDYSNISKVRCSECRKAKRHNLKSSKSRCCQSGGKQNDIILKFEKSDVVNRCCQWRKAKQHNSQIWKVRRYQWRKANVEVSGWYLRLSSGPWGFGVVLGAQRWYELS